MNLAWAFLAFLALVNNFNLAAGYKTPSRQVGKKAKYHKEDKQDVSKDHQETADSTCRPPHKDLNGFGQTKIMETYSKYIRNGKIGVSWQCHWQIKGKKKVVIVGAGASGLIAANILEKEGFQVTVLEASNRIGGRIQTYRDTRYGFIVELGPMRIPEHHILTLEVCKKYNLKLGTFNDQTSKFAKGNLYDSTSDFFENLHKEDKCGDFGPNCHLKVSELFSAFDEPKEDLACLPFKDVIRKYDQYTVSNWLEKKLPQFSGTEFLHFIVAGALASFRDVNIIDFVGTDLLHFENQTFYMLKDGFDQIARSMAEDLNGKSSYLHLNKKVHEITRLHVDKSYEKVKVKYQCFGTNCGKETNEVIADYAIVTTPAPLTTSMKFSPELDQTQWHGLRIMKYTTPVKVILVFKDQWWKVVSHRGPNLKGGISTDLNFQQLWFPPEQPSNGLGVLLSSYAYGMTSQRYTGMSDDDVVTEMVDNLAVVFNKTVDFVRGRLVQHVIKRWGTDPYQLGGFATEGANEFGMYGSSIGQPNGHLLFAGEHMVTPHGWINSALMSGIKAAKQVMDDACQAIGKKKRSAKKGRN